ncbi:MAG: alternate-type signal peptide domain-containing protein [Micrococcales bacterium]|nr:alternate-type signal peptide domain-containing protein [Micrococcales bacterium]MCL2668272.1 alternate-type signal peptide domain-containing protein [Micrococcales bacterium]
MDTNTVVVVAEERHRRRGLLLALVGAALLFGGSTFALWAANDSLTGGTVTAGDLDLVRLDDTAFYDVSADRKDAGATLPGTDGSQKGHVIDDVADWRIVPGDKVAAVFSARVTLEGDNMVAELSIAGLEETLSKASLLTWTYEVYEDETLLFSEEKLADGTLLHLSAVADGQDDGLEDADGTTVYAMEATSVDFTVVVYGEFDPEAGDAAKDDVDANGVYLDMSAETGTRLGANTVDELTNITLKLKQVRGVGAQFATP